MIIAGALLISLVVAQEPDQRIIDEWILGLGADEIEAREKAQIELVRLGAVAAPSLRRAAGDPDLERACRARTILGRLEGKKHAAADKHKSSSNDDDGRFDQWVRDPRSGRVFRMRVPHFGIFDAWFWPFWGFPESVGPGG